MTDLGTLGGKNSEAYAINNNGQIVGWAGPHHAFLYNPESNANLSVTPTILRRNCSKGLNAASQNFTVQNTGTGTLSYSINKDAAWLSVTPTSGTSTGEQDIITVNYATSGLAVGKYVGFITVTASGATGTTQSILVVLKVNAPSIAPLLLLLLDQ